MAVETDVVVVGAGQAGLGAAYAVQEMGLNVVVLERGRTGETWRSQRWDSFALNTPNWMNGLPGAPYDGSDPFGFMTHHELAESFDAYVSRFDLDVVNGVTVTSVEQHDGGPRFSVKGTSGQGPVSYDAACVVVASGILQSPRVPSQAESVPADIVQLTTGSYRSPDTLPDGAVVVVGGGQSGAQIVEDLHSHGRTVYFSISNVVRVPRRYRGRDFMDWWVEMGVWDVRVDEVADPRELSATNPLVSGVGALGHSISYQHLAHNGVQLLGRLERIDNGVIITDDRVPEYIKQADEFSTDQREEIDGYIEERGLEVTLAEPDPADEPLPPGETVEFRTELDLHEAGVSTLIWSTGFTADFSWLNVPVTDDNGRPIHHDGIADTPGIYFIGFPWLSKRKSGVVLGIEEDASRIAQEAHRHIST